MSEHGIEGGQGTMGTVEKPDRKCDCEGCRTQRHFYCEDIERRDPARKHPNAPSTLRLQ